MYMSKRVLAESVLTCFIADLALRVHLSVLYTFRSFNSRKGSFAAICGLVSISGIPHLLRGMNDPGDY
jgi:hypothetical protein